MKTQSHVCIEEYRGYDGVCSCQASDYCPSDTCQVHGERPWPPRCCVCGRFMKLNADWYIHPQEAAE